jgi:hypothetical protein
MIVPATTPPLKKTSPDPALTPKKSACKIKQQALIAVDKTTDGWYTSSGLSSLPSELKTRLFKIGVANEVDSGKTGELDYGYYINNHYYLTSTVYQSDETSTSFPYVIYDKTTTTWYVIRVDEAVKLSKLADGSGSYDAMTSHSGTDKTYWPIFRSTVAYESLISSAIPTPTRSPRTNTMLSKRRSPITTTTSTTISRRLSPISSIDRNSSYNEGARLTLLLSFIGGITMSDIFCKIIAGEIPSTKVYEDDDVLAILDISQTTRGHTLVMPKKHYDNFLSLPAGARP